MILEEDELKDFCKKLPRSEFEDSERAKKVAIKAMRVVLLALGYDTDFVEDKFRTEVEKAIVVNGNGIYDNFFKQQELAEILGIKRNTYSDWENGKTEPSFENLLKLADLLEVSLDWLFGRE